MVNWKDVKKGDTLGAAAVVERAVNEGTCVDPISLQLDLEAVSLSVSMDWEGLLKASEGNFYHDLDGIQRYLNRETGKLENCFFPRFAT